MELIAKKRSFLKTIFLSLKFAFKSLLVATSGRVFPVRANLRPVYSQF